MVRAKIAGVLDAEHSEQKLDSGRIYFLHMGIHHPLV